MDLVQNGLNRIYQLKATTKSVAMISKLIVNGMAGLLCEIYCLTQGISRYLFVQHYLHASFPRKNL